MSNSEAEPSDAVHQRFQERSRIETQIRTRYRRLAWRQRITGVACFAVGLANGFIASEAFLSARESAAGGVQQNPAHWLFAGASLEAIRRASKGAKNEKARTYNICDEFVAAYAEKYQQDDPDIRYYRPEPVVDGTGPRVDRVHDPATFDGPKRDHMYKTAGAGLKDKGRDLSAVSGGFVIGVMNGALSEVSPSGTIAQSLGAGAACAVLSAAFQTLDERANRAYVSDFVHQLDNLDSGFGPASGGSPSPGA